MTKSLIAIDWGTTRARAFLIGADGEVKERRAADRGIQSVATGGFPTAFADIAGELRRAEPEAPVLLAGMVGSRNGWIEAPYVACPASAEDIAAAALTVTLDDGSAARILPGLSCDEGAFDVMRGEETLIVGLGLQDGMVCLPGTHSKWAEIRGGRIVRFASFMTGEVFGLLRHHSILARLAEEPAGTDAANGLQRGLAAARRDGGFLNTAFAARTEVLAGRMSGGEVGPYLSALLVAEEVRGALARFGVPGTVDLVAEGAVADSYRSALDEAGLSFRVTTPEAAFAAGIVRLSRFSGG